MMPPPRHDERAAATAAVSPRSDEETSLRLVEWGALAVAFAAGLVGATEQGKLAPFLLGWGATAAFTWWASQH